MRNTAVRLALTLPEGSEIRWPDLCSACGAKEIAGQATTSKNAPPVPYCGSCLAIHRRWTTWITLWLGCSFLLILGPLLYLGISLDRPLPTAGPAHNSGLLYMDLAFFAVILSAVAAGIGFIRRSELQGVQVQEVRSVVDDLEAPLHSGETLVEIRFKNCDFYSAALDANRAPE